MKVATEYIQPMNDYFTDMYRRWMEELMETVGNESACWTNSGRSLQRKVKQTAPEVEERGAIIAEKVLGIVAETNPLHNGHFVSYQ